MKGKNKIVYYLMNHSWFLLILLLLLVMGLISITYTVLFSVVCFVILFFTYFITHKDFIIEDDGILLLNKFGNDNKYRFSEINQICFIERYYMITENKKIKLILCNKDVVSINCNGLISDDDYSNYPDSFDSIFEYTKQKFENTCYIE
jgi:hypothetical protein